MPLEESVIESLINKCYNLETLEVSHMHKLSGKTREAFGKMVSSITFSSAPDLKTLNFEAFSDWKD